jgi:tRNA pseudouridine65 synthase
MTNLHVLKIVPNTVLAIRHILKLRKPQSFGFEMQRDRQEVWTQIKKIEILYEDDVLIALLKPTGVLVHQTMGLNEPTLAGWVKKHLSQQESYPVYRLDRGTSGVVLFAKTKEAVSWLNQNQPRKNYLLATRGVVPERGYIDNPVPNRKGDQKVEAQTRYRRLSTFQMEHRQCSWVMARPVTGRMHQIRKHFKHLSFPLLGDVKYGKGDMNRMFRSVTELHRLMLHAYSIVFKHPVTRENMKVRAAFFPQEREAFLRLGAD